MRTETRYICEVCGYRYNTEEECAKCESSHNNATEILSQKFDHHFGDNAKYPGSIIVKMANDHKIEYRYFKPVIEPTTEHTTADPEPTEPEEPTTDPVTDPNEPIFDPTNP